LNRASEGARGGGGGRAAAASGGQRAAADAPLLSLTLTPGARTRSGAGATCGRCLLLPLLLQGARPLVDDDDESSIAAGEV